MVLSEGNVETILGTASLIRAFEERAANEAKEGRITMPIYLSTGQEFVAASLSAFFNGTHPGIFTQHRNHSYFLAFGGSPEDLLLELRGDSTRSSFRGYAGSIGLFDHEISFFGHTGLLGEQIYIGTGWAFATKRPSLIVMGDATLEEDYTFPCLGFAATHSLPITYVCEDNGYAVLTPTDRRRSWNIEDVANAYGVATARIPDDPQLILRALSTLPCPRLIVVDVQRVTRHVGFQYEGRPRWERNKLFFEVAKSILGTSRANLIIEQSQARIDELLS